MLLAAAIALIVGAVVLTLFIRPADLPVAEAVSPTFHLEMRKAQIYENLRDLTFEFRVGKLSEADYQQTKLGLQAELAVVLSQIDEVAKLDKPTKKAAPSAFVCPKCGARFDRALKFCGECGQSLAREAS